MFTIRVLSFFAGGEGFAVDAALVHKITRKMKMTPVPAAPLEVAGIANLKGKVVTILDIAALLGPDMDGGRRWAERGPRTVNAVIFKPYDGGDQMGLVIDKPGGLAETDENGGADANRTPHISGAAEFGGVLYKIIDIDSIIGRFKDGGGSYAAQRGGTVNEENS